MPAWIARPQRTVTEYRPSAPMSWATSAGLSPATPVIVPRDQREDAGRRDDEDHLDDLDDRHVEAREEIQQRSRLLARKPQQRDAEQEGDEDDAEHPAVVRRRVEDVVRHHVDEGLERAALGYLPRRRLAGLDVRLVGLLQAGPQAVRNRRAGLESRSPE